jgi:hypothetical protein
MSIVKTLPELALERMNHCSDVLANKYLKSVRAIYGSTENGKPIHIGSCVAVKLNNENYLITAAHVIDHNKFTSLYVSGENDLVLIEAAAHITAAPDGDREKDIFDFAILKPSSEMEEKIGNIEYICQSEMLLRDLKDAEKFCLALGYPNSKNKLNPKNGNSVKETPFVYTSVLKHEADFYSKAGANKSQHYLLDYCKNHSKDQMNNKVNSISPKGVSGGGLFFIEGMTNPELYKPDSPCAGKLVGVLIEFRKEHKVLLYTKLSTILSALTSR